MKVTAKTHQFDPPDGIYIKLDLTKARKHPYTTTREHRYVSHMFSLIVPEGFGFDLASVPSMLLWLFSPYGRHQRAAMYHDWAYYSQPCTRFEADSLFRAIMHKYEVNSFKAFLMYYTVRLCGWYLWKQHSERIANG